MTMVKLPTGPQETTGGDVGRTENGGMASGARASGARLEG